MPRGIITPTLYTYINAHDNLFPDITQTITFFFLVGSLIKVRVSTCWETMEERRSSPNEGKKHISKCSLVGVCVIRLICVERVDSLMSVSSRFPFSAFRTFKTCLKHDRKSICSVSRPSLS